MGVQWIAVDWGTTNFRAWLMEGERVLQQTVQPCGLRQVKDGAFAETLYVLIKDWLQKDDPLPLLMAGMVGSRQGWCEVPYCPVSVGIADLAAGMRHIETFWGSPAWIVPGVSGINHAGLPDVMRGEEVQLLGLQMLADTPVEHVILPGTHSKHVTIQDGRIHTFSTYMTGELWHVLMANTLLGHDLLPSEPNEQAFAMGVANSQCNEALSMLLFSARTLRLKGALGADEVRDYLSGLLIGHELRHCPTQGTWVVGSPVLIERYRYAASQYGIVLHSLDGDLCFTTGMTRLFHVRQGTIQ